MQVPILPINENVRRLPRKFHWRFCEPPGFSPASISLFIYVSSSSSSFSSHFSIFYFPSFSYSHPSFFFPSPAFFPSTRLWTCFNIHTAFPFSFKLVVYGLFDCRELQSWIAILAESCRRISKQYC